MPSISNQSGLLQIPGQVGKKILLLLRNPADVIKKIRLIVQNPGERNASPLTQLAAWPVVVSAQTLGLEKKTRVSFAWSTPDIDEFIERYLRGYLLFGRVGRLPKFEWQSFAHRAIATTETAKVPKSLRRVWRNHGLEVRFGQGFEEIAMACQERPSGGWTWLTDDLVDYYRKLHAQGFVCPVGTYRDGRLIGGQLGITIGRAFTGMTMFHRESDAGSIAIAAVMDIVAAGDGRWELMDFITLTSHNPRFGAELVPEERFLRLLRQHSAAGTPSGETQSALVAGRH